jgi:hypothetical protein
MTTIKSIPHSMQNGDRVTYYQNTVGLFDEIFAYQENQEKVILVNKGDDRIHYLIGDKSGYLWPSERVTVEGSISSVTLRATSKTQFFELWSDEEGKSASTGDLTEINQKIESFDNRLTNTVKVVSVENYGAIPNGSNNDSDSINSAIGYAASSGIKTVYVPDGTFNIHSTIVVERGIHLQLSPKAVLKAKQDVNIVQLKPDSKITSGVIDASEVPSFTSACIFLSGNDIFKLLNDHSYGNGTILKGKDHEYTDQKWTGIGIHLHSGKGFNNNPSYVSFVRFMQLGIFNFEYGILLETDQTITQESEMAWVNGNSFDQVNMMNCPKAITLRGDSKIPRDVSGNKFSNMQVQVNSYCDWAINCEGGWNTFEGTWWDLHRMPSDKAAIRFGSDSRFNTAYTMHGYETPRHFDDLGYLNTIHSSTNHIPDKRNLFHPLPVPYKPNTLGNQDDYLAGGDLRGYTITQIQTTDPLRAPTLTLPQGIEEVGYAQGKYETLFSLSTELGVYWDNLETDWDNPIVLEIDCSTDPIPFLGHLGFISAYDNQPQNAVFEVYNGTSWMEHGDWLQYNKNEYLFVSAPHAVTETIYKIRLSVWGSNQPNGKIQISRIFAASTTTPGNAFIQKNGDTVTGDMIFKGSMVIPVRTSDPTSPKVGQMWFRSDL